MNQRSFLNRMMERIRIWLTEDFYAETGHNEVQRTCITRDGIDYRFVKLQRGSYFVEVVRHDDVHRTQRFGVEEPGKALAWMNAGIFPNEVIEQLVTGKPGPLPASFVEQRKLNR